MNIVRKIIALFTESSQHFQGQHDNEKVIMILRQHVFTVSYPLTLVFLAAFIPLLIKLAFSAHIAEQGLEDLFLFISSVWYAALWLLAFYYLMLYSLNTVIITDRRIIENEQTSFFDRKVAELHLYRVQDVSVHTQGPIQTFLSFGDVMVQTAASEREFLFEKVGHPELVKDAIMHAVSSHRSNLNLS